jgi:hypothetical protein
LLQDPGFVEIHLEEELEAALRRARHPRIMTGAGVRAMAEIGSE